MHNYQLAMFLMQLTWLLFVLAFGACVGSLINVLVYRLPLGLSVVTPPSRCPSCGTRLSWRDNIPVLGWIFLRGRCRYCKTKISSEYPLVEAFTALLFGAFYALWFMVPRGTVWLGVDWGSIRPEWALNDATVIWPTFTVLLLLLGSLVAMTIVDAKTFTIPLELTVFPTVAGLLVHTAHAAWLEVAGTGIGPSGGLRFAAPGAVWSIPTPSPSDWGVAFAAIGGFAGVIVAILLVRSGLLRRSFADYDEWERSVMPPQAHAGEGDGTDAAAPAPAAEPASAAATAVAAAPVVERDVAPADLWIQYPHARREMLKEVLFLAPCLGLATLGWYLAEWLAISGPMPLWLNVLGGVLLGYLVGGGVVWAVRILGTLAFGKEAMGLGDVHLMGAVGACLGWIDATLAFFGAAFVGLFFTIGSALFAGGLKRTMPYGPYLAISTVLVLLCKPLIEHGLTLLTGGVAPVNIP